MAKIKLLSRKELTDILGCKQSTVRSWINRGNIAESKEGFINVYNLQNQDWLTEYCAKNNIDIKRIYELKTIAHKPNLEKKNKELREKINKSEPKEEVEPGVVSKYSELRDKKLAIETGARELEIELKRLEIDKKKAKVIPVEFGIEAFKLYLNGNITGILSDSYKIIDDAIDKLGGDYKMKLETRKLLKESLSKTIKANHTRLVKEISEIAKEYSLKRNW